MLKKLNQQEALALYDEHIIKDFIENTIPPYSMYKQAIQNQDYIACQYEEEGIAKAYFIYREKEPHTLLLFFAVHEGKRGKGIGTKALQEFIQQEEGKAIIIEVEKEKEQIEEKEKQIIQKRIQFYEKEGFKIVKDLSYKLGKEFYHIMIHSKEEKPVQDIKEILYTMYEDLLKNKKWLEIKIIPKTN